MRRFVFVALLALAVTCCAGTEDTQNTNNNSNNNNSTTKDTSSQKDVTVDQLEETIEEDAVAEAAAETAAETAPTCTDDCDSAGKTTCTSATTYSECAEGADGCLDLLEKSCGEGEKCQGTMCIKECDPATACPVGEKKCEGNKLFTCNAEGTCPNEWLDFFKESLERVFGTKVALNAPFKGGYIIRHHSGELPWIQIELSRAAFTTNHEKRGRLLESLILFYDRISSQK